MDGKQLQSQYKDHLSDFQNWDQRAHAQEYILYPKNMGYRQCIDETALSKGDLYTILINRDKRGRKGSMTVSYTHLDVYKRQTQYSGFRPESLNLCP